jgi:hypothetical protein
MIAEHLVGQSWSHRASKCNKSAHVQVLNLEVCTDPGLTLGPRHDTAREPGPGLVAQIMFGFGPGSNDTNQTLYRTFRAFWNHSFFFFFAKNKLFVVALILCSWRSRAPEKIPSTFDFLGDFRSCLLPETVRDNTLQTWHPISLCRFWNAKITSDVLRKSLNNSFKDYWNLCIKRDMY